MTSLLFPVNHFVKSSIWEVKSIQPNDPKSFPPWTLNFFRPSKLVFSAGSSHTRELPHESVPPGHEPRQIWDFCLSNQSGSIHYLFESF